MNTIIKRLNEKTNNLLNDADNLYNVTLIKLPMTVRQMNWIEYCGLCSNVLPAFSSLHLLLHNCVSGLNKMSYSYICLSGSVKPETPVDETKVSLCSHEHFSPWKCGQTFKNIAQILSDVLV